MTIAFAALFACACGKQPGGQVTDPRAVLDGALQRIDAVVSKGPGFDYGTLRQEMLKDPGVQLIGTSADGALWATAGENGPLLLVAIDPTPSASTTVAPPRMDPVDAARSASLTGVPHALGKPASPRATAAGPTEIPSVATYRAYFGLGNAFSDPTPDLASYLGKKGYKAASTASPTTAELRTGLQVAQSTGGVFFIKTHGDVLHTTNPLTGQTDSYFALYTATPYDGLNVSKEDGDDLTRRRLVIFNAVNKRAWTPEDASEKHLAITADFVKTYMSFPPNSFVFVSACYSASDDAAPFAQAFLDKGASVYAGWDNPADKNASDDSARYVFDRLLGANTFRPESPLQRPFDYVALKDDLARTGLDRAGVANLRFLPPASSAMGLLAPSIAYADPVDETSGEITLHGAFGTKVGAVYVGAAEDGTGGTALSGCTFSGDTVKCQIGEDQAGYLVTGVNGVRSNPVHLTSWRVLLHYSSNLGSVCSGDDLFKLDAVMHLRADIQQYRDEPHADPTGPKPATLQAALDSGCTASASGSCTTPGLPTITLSGGKSLPATLKDYASNPTGEGCWMPGEIDFKAGSYLLGLDFYLRDAYTEQSSLGTFTKDMSGGTYVLGDPSASVLAPDGTPFIPVAAHFAGTTLAKGDFSLKSETGDFWLKWDATDPDESPSDNTPR